MKKKFFILGRGWLGEAQRDGGAPAADVSAAGQGGGGARVRAVWGERGMWGVWEGAMKEGGE